MFKTKNGITLIALIITIIILIIISAVTIKLNIGDKSIFKYAKEAKDSYQNNVFLDDKIVNMIDVASYRNMSIDGELLARIEKLESDNKNLSEEINEISNQLSSMDNELNALSNSKKIKSTALWSGSASNGNTVTLSQSYKNFDILYFYISYRVNDCYCVFPTLTSTISTYNSYNRGLLFTTYDTEYITLKFNSETSVKLTSAGGSNNLLRIVGVKFE